jgi:signal transduction histidine kinase
VLTNVILNALDAMPDGGQLHITTETDGDNVIVFVRDTGTGMTDETRRRALEPFFTTKVDVGSGLGLATVRGTVEGWRGRVDIDSQLGVGTTVRLTIPAAERQLAADAARSPTEPATS